MRVRHVAFYADEWIAGTAGMDDAVIGVYITVCAAIYSHGGPVEISDVKRLIRSHGRTFSRAISQLVASGKLIETGSKLDSKRCETELKRAGNRTETARKNGSKGGRPNGLAKPGGLNSEKLTKELKNLRTKEPYSPPPPKGDAIDDFDRFWKTYPRRIDKGHAKKAWAKAIKTATPSEIIEGAERYAKAKAGTDLQYVAHPSSWLNGERWGDELPSIPRSLSERYPNEGVY